ncbi:hypothetical protein COA08_22830 [Bacillus cereus]|uniref:Uncharacterized protein n=1 Tax=Bacillus cereus TaxID=1396 RepID=A0A2C0EIW0_BACCE|nr:hypothetical protein CON06_30040 [Bacillus cereus]PFA03177.1 hypothetical protein CN382_29445 [Bacillus cereus]PFM33563.1 hypothetical protein COJ43_25630 [Bacillus cereus]PGQ06385.1 hypothetical protein COA08_22830 [Bacillus cereus]
MLLNVMYLLLFFAFFIRGVPPHIHQAKILKYPLNGNSIFFIVQKFNFIVLGKNVFLKLIAMGTAPLTL